MTPAFDPASCALFAHIAEQAAYICLCPIRRRRVVPHARQWLRRNSERAIDIVEEDAAESVLDALNSVEPALIAVLCLVIWLRLMTAARSSSRENRH
jgi:hypothetical protein